MDGDRPDGKPPTYPDHLEKPGDVRSALSGARMASPQATLARLNAELGPELSVIRHIGDESFGSLFLAHEASLRRDVVIKVLRREFVENDEARRRFVREARAAGKIEHANVVQVFRVGELESGVPYFVEPYLGDCTLRDRLKSVGRFQPGEVREILHQLASALQAAHRTGIVHRDVRPGTVRCEGESQRMLLTDFGIAGILESAGLDEDTITYPGEVLGSPGYMSPEQREGLEVTDRSDTYSLGVLGWRLLAGASAKVPADEDTDRSVMLSVAPDDPALIDLLLRCMRESPGERPSADGIVRALETAGRRQGRGGAWADLMERRIPVVAFLMGLMMAAIGVVGSVLDVATSEPRPFWTAITVLTGVFVAGLVSAWFHGKKGRQAFTRVEVGIYAAIGVVTTAAIILVWRLTAPG